MKHKKNWLVTLVGLAAAGVLSACCSNAPRAQIPDIVPGKLNVAMVLSSPHDDGRWSQSQYEGLQNLKNLRDNVHVEYVENVAEFCDSSGVFRQLARKGFSLIIGTAFGYGDSLAVAAADYPEVTFLHLAGFNPRQPNLSPVNGAMEEMVYLAGMLAGGRAKVNEKPKLGFLATLPVPEQFRMINAAALGMRRTCEECQMEVRWLHAWADGPRERELAEGFFQDGAQVVFSGAESPGVIDIAANHDKWAVAFGRSEYCESKGCLTATYWNWGPIYATIVDQLEARSYRPTRIYFRTVDGGLGLYGMMPGDPITEGMQGLPAEVTDEVHLLLERLRNGDIDTQRAVFKGEIKDNQGNVIVKEGESLEAAALDQFPPGAPDERCVPYCMYWFAEGITSELPEIGK